MILVILVTNMRSEYMKTQNSKDGHSFPKELYLMSRLVNLQKMDLLKTELAMTMMLRYQKFD